MEDMVVNGYVVRPLAKDELDVGMRVMDIEGHWAVNDPEQETLLVVGLDGDWFIGEMEGYGVHRYKTHGWGLVVGRLSEASTEEAEVVESVRDKVRARYAL